MLEAIGGHELQRKVAVGYLLVVSILALFVAKRLIDRDLSVEDVFCRPSVNVLKIAI